MDSPKTIWNYIVRFWKTDKSKSKKCAQNGLENEKESSECCAIEKKSEENSQEIILTNEKDPGNLSMNETDNKNEITNQNVTFEITNQINSNELYKENKLDLSDERLSDNAFEDLKHKDDANHEEFGDSLEIPDMSQRKRSLPSKLSRHPTCSIDLSDKTIRLSNTHQFKSFDTHSSLPRRRSVDFEDIVGKIEPISNFEELDELGKGAFGRAIKVKHIETDRYFVMKEVLTHSPENEKSLLKEVALLRTLVHPNILVYEGLVLKNKRICLLTKLMEGGSLQGRILNLSIEVTLIQKVQFLLDIAAGMSYLHEKSIMHRDLSSLNCLLSKDNRVVVSDFGLSKYLPNVYDILPRASSPNILRPDNKIITLNSKSTDDLLTVDPIKISIHHDKKGKRDYSKSFSDLSNELNNEPLSINKSVSGYSNICCHSPNISEAKKNFKYNQLKRKHTVVGNPFFMAPEMLANTSYSSQVDIYSFGIIGCEVTGRINSEPDYLDRHIKDLSVNFELFLEKNKTELEKCPFILMEMIHKCCSTKPESRPSFNKCLSLLEDVHFKLSTNLSIRSSCCLWDSDDSE